MDWMLLYVIVLSSLIREIIQSQPDGFIGCYPEQKPFNGESTNASGGHACMWYCFKKGYKYKYAATFAAKCYCFHNLSGNTDDGACSWRCNNDVNEICGGMEKWSVYDVTKTTTTTVKSSTTTATTNKPPSPASANLTISSKDDTSTTRVAADDITTIEPTSLNVTIVTCSNVSANGRVSEDRVGLIMLVVVVVVVNVVICAVLVARHFRRKRRRKLRKLRLMNQENDVENNTVDARVPDVSGVQVDVESEYDTTLSCKPKQQCRRTENEYGRLRTPGGHEDPDYSHNGSNNLRTCSLEDDEYSRIGSSKQKTCSIKNDEYSHIGGSALKTCSIENDEYSHIGSNKQMTCSLEKDDYSYLKETSKTACNKKHNIDSSDYDSIAISDTSNVQWVRNPGLQDADYDSIAISDTSNVQWVRNPGLQDADDDLYVNLSYNGSKIK